MRILKAAHYAHLQRTVIVVALDDTPEAVHADGTPHVGKPPVGTVAGLKSWEWCTDCVHIRSDYREREFIFQGDDLYSNPVNATPKTDGELIAEVLAIIKTPIVAPVRLVSLEGRTLEGIRRAPANSPEPHQEKADQVDKNYKTGSARSTLK
jgi:hypothetical protein